MNWQKPPRFGSGSPAPSRPDLWRLATTGGVPKRSAQVALVVGTVLCLINQGDVIVAGEVPNLWKAALTYCVPYCVATYGAVTARLDAARTAIE